MAKAVPAHPLIGSFLRRCGWAPTRRDVALYKLNQWHRWLEGRGVDLLAVTRSDCDDYLDELEARGLAAATRFQSWDMAHALHRWLKREGEIDANPWRKVKAPELHETPVRDVTAAEAHAIMATCDRRTEYGRRDEAILSLLWWSGPRGCEVAAADLDAIDLDHARFTIGSRTFATKNRQVRRIPLAADTVDALDRYLRRRGLAPGPLFLSQRGDTHRGRRLATASIAQMIERRAARAGLGRNVGVHEFRRAMAVNHRARGGSELGLMAIGGWKDVRMVARYTRMHQEELAADEFHRLIDTSADPTRRTRRRRSA